MREILFASTNIGKIGQFQFVADAYNFKVKIISLYERFKISPYNEEYKTPEAIVEKGSEEIFSQIHEPIVVEDSVFEVDALNKRPGVDSADYLKKFKREGILKEMEGIENRKARLISCVGYRDEKGFKLFKNIVEGTVAHEVRYKVGEPLWVGPTEAWFGGGYNSIFIPDSLKTKTTAECTAQECLTLGDREPNFKLVLEWITEKQL